VYTSYEDFVVEKNWRKKKEDRGSRAQKKKRRESFFCKNREFFCHLDPNFSKKDKDIFPLQREPVARKKKAVR
jgi:hypothetical protein